jgi:hypothetical protein
MGLLWNVVLTVRVHCFAIKGESQESVQAVKKRAVSLGLFSRE